MITPEIGQTLDFGSAAPRTSAMRRTGPKEPISLAFE